MDHSACLASGGLVKLSVQLPFENLWETFFTLDVHDDVELSCVLGGLVHDVLRVVVQRAVVVAHLGAELLKRDGSSSPAHDAGENPFAAWWLISLCPPPPPGRGASPAWITFCSPAIPWPACSPKAKSSEVVVATPEGVVKTRTIKRLLQESRWDADAVIRRNQRDTLGTDRRRHNSASASVSARAITGAPSTSSRSRSETSATSHEDHEARLRQARLHRRM